MAYIKCHSFIQNKEVEYNLIGVKLKHKVRDQDYGTSNLNYQNSYFNTSPYSKGNQVLKNAESLEKKNSYIYGTSGKISQGYSASGVLEVEYDNSNTGRNPLITGKSYDIDDLEHGFNYFDLFETDTIKVMTVIVKLKQSEIQHPSLPNQTFREIDGTYITGDIDIIYAVYLRYILKSNGKVVGEYNITDNTTNEIYLKKFSVNSELFWIKDFNPKYKSGYSYQYNYSMYLTSYQSENNGLYINGSKSTEPGNFVGISHSLLASEYWYAPRNTYNLINVKLVDESDNLISNSKLRSLNVNADVLFYRHKISTDPDNMMILNADTINMGLDTTSGERVQWANENINNENLKLISYDFSDNNLIRGGDNYITSPILMPCVNPTTYEPANFETEGMFISLTQEIFEGTAPEPEPDEEPLEPETVEPAVNPETEYTPPLQEAFEEFPYRDSDTISGLEPGYNAFRPSYSNYIFPKYYRDSIVGDSDWESAITFIQEACNPSSFELWGAAFKLITGHPTPGEIISRVYYLPFEYNEIRGTDSAGFYFSAPVYGPVGPVTLGVKTHSEDPSNTGKPTESNVHYYQQIANRFKTINLGQVTIDRVFNNFLDYSEVNYTLNLPYGAGQVELDPDLLFKNDTSDGDVKLTGVIDFDAGELTIIIQLNGQRYYETTVNVAIDRLASVADNMAAPLAIAKASMAAGAAAGGITRMVGGAGQSFNSNQTYDLKNAEVVNRVQHKALGTAGDLINDLNRENQKLKGGK